MIALRPHQEQAVNALLSHWEHGGGHALVDLATGTGKSLVAAELCRSVASVGGRVIILTHVRELVQQNFMAMLKLWPAAPAGIFSAGLGRRDARAQIIFASIQTVHRHAELIGAVDLILIDEVHLVPKKGEGMYRRFLDAMDTLNPQLRVGGLTATPFRLGEGRLDTGPHALFTSTVYTYGIADGIRDGWLSPLVSRAGQSEIDTSRVTKVGGDFKASSLERAAQSITAAAVSELIALAGQRKAWLTFCSGVAHAYQVRDALRAQGIVAETITGETPPGERDRIIAAFRAGRVRCLTNANVLTTGFDAPNVDVVALMRATLSTSLYIQMVGRGTRLAPHKDNCLVLDWGGNIRRHGPVDMVVPREPGSSGEDEGRVAESSVLARPCPDCETMVHIAVRICPHCEHEFPAPERTKHDPESDRETPILSTEKVPPRHLGVVTWRARRHVKFGSEIASMAVEYVCGLSTFTEWVAFEHDGFPRQKAQKWWLEHGGCTPFPATSEDALSRLRGGEVDCPKTITVRPRGKYHDITGRTHHETTREESAA